jgi:predicted O-methyltransferase YrrM
MMLLRTLRHQTDAPIYVVGNLGEHGRARMRAFGVTYIDERDVDLQGRFPEVNWDAKYRNVGWYRQMLLRLSVDRYVDADHVVVLDSEVFCFDNWDERRLYANGRLKSLGWVPTTTPEWDSRMYQGAALLISGLRGCEDAPAYAASPEYRRHISGVVLFSTANLRHLWGRLEQEADLPSLLDRLFNQEPEVAFSDHDTYGIAVDLGVFDDVDPAEPVEELLGWYDRHSDPAFEGVTHDAMWSMCQTYRDYRTPRRYLAYMERRASELQRRLPDVPYWNPGDRELLLPTPPGEGPTDYFGTYQKQLDHTFRGRYGTMRGALDLLAERRPGKATIVEIGTSRDENVGGGHSTFKFGEYLSRQGGVLHSVDISAEAIDFSRRATADYLPWIRHHVSDPTAFLARFDGQIDLLYLDGLDSTPGHEEVAAKKQLEEIQTALPKLSPEAVVLLDDAALPLEGKTRLSSAFLEERGFERVLDDYQRLFVRRPPSAGPAPVRGVRALLRRAAGAVQRRARAVLERRKS